ncbi:MAG TPA: translesion error-prone DNA polymerase V autoproteolytic subunit, partial [Candidatus Caenarcaniphilales bacterium]
WIDTLYKPRYSTRYKLPLYLSAVSAGFPLPGDDHVEQRLDLNDLIEHPAATFFARVSGDSMQNAGIFHGDIAVVSRALEPADGRVVVAVVNGEMLIKRISQQGDRLFLLAENPDYPPLEITDGMDFHVWGVVTTVVHRV